MSAHVFLAALPWALVALYAAWKIRFPRPLPAPRHTGPAGGEPPLVSVIVPARNEEATIETCVRSLAGSRYPAFEILVVDDRSEDRTAELVRAMDPGGARRLEVIEGRALPEGWLGKPWACWQGFQEARGELVLFTDSDTEHGPDLLARAVAGLVEDDVAAVTIMGRQRMVTFWEKVIQPQVFTLMAFRFPNLRRPVLPGRCRDAIASGQFIMLHRAPYVAIGGHEAVRREVVEDLRLAQLLCRGGYRLSVRAAEDAFVTRMYRSLGHLIEGWTKNVAIGSAYTLPPAVRRIALPVVVAAGVLLWIVPPVVLAASLAGLGGAGLRLWGGVVCGLSAVFWCGAAGRMGIPPLWGLFYPLGTAMGVFIFVRSLLRGTTVEWKGRTYRVEMEEGVLK